MPMNEYGEIIRNSSPPPPIPPENHNNRNNRNRNHSGGGRGIAIVWGIIIFVVAIWFIDNMTSNNYSGGNRQNTVSNYGKNIKIVYGDSDGGSSRYSDAYILPSSDSEYISYSDLSGLSQTEVSLARNEIYARHGRKFTVDSIKKYFESQSWYQPRINPDDFSESVFNKYEKKNIDTIVKYEKDKGWR